MWKRIEKAMTLCLAVLLVAVATVSGTLAYQSRSAVDFAADDSHEIDVQLIRRQSDGNDGRTEDIIQVKNSGGIDTFNRVLIAVPADQDGMLHLEVGEGWNLAKTLKNQLCGEESCNIYIFTMNSSLGAGSISEPAVFAGISMDASDAEQNVTFRIEAQAVQAYDFDSAREAFAAISMPENPWLEENN